MVLGFELKKENIGRIHIFLVPYFLFLAVVELGRAPFDFPERERELVRGYNIEYGGSFFVLLFLREYGFLIFFRVLMRFIFFNGRLFAQAFFIYFILLLRRVYPRTKFNQLMTIFWFLVLPLMMWVAYATYLFFYLLVYLVRPSSKGKVPRGK
jgi:NADH:ubiquinone oxidoreductase subunit H